MRPRSRRLWGVASAPAALVYAASAVLGYAGMDSRFPALTNWGIILYAGYGVIALYLVVALDLTFRHRDRREMALLWIVGPLLTGAACVTGHLPASLGTRLWFQTVIAPRVVAIRAAVRDAGRLPEGFTPLTVEGYTFEGVLKTPLGIGLFTSRGGPPTNPGGIFVPFEGARIEPFEFDLADYARRARSFEPLAGLTQLLPTCVDGIFWFSTS